MATPLKLQIVKDDIFSYADTPEESVLCEDMYQAACGRYIIDCGWYGNGEEGRFITFLIEDYDWENPVIKIITQNIKDAQWSINVSKEHLGDRI